MKSSLFVSVAAPIHNDADIIESFVKDVIAVMKAEYENYEIILVDDGSTDDSVHRLRPLLHELECIRVLRLSRRFGLEIALTAALESAIGDYVVTLLPNSDPPALIPSLVAMAQSQKAVILGIDKNWPRRPWTRRLAGRIFHWSCAQIFGLAIPEHTTHLRVLTRQAVNAVIQIKDKYRHLRALTPYIGYQTVRHEYDQINRRGRPRRDSFWESLEDAVNIIVSSSTRPLRIISLVGLLASVLNLLYIGYVIAIAIFKQKVAEGWITLSFQHSVMFFFIFAILTVITEYIGRILNETKDRPLYYIREEINSSVTLAHQDRRNVVTESE